MSEEDKFIIIWLNDGGYVKFKEANATIQYLHNKKKYTSVFKGVLNERPLILIQKCGIDVAIRNITMIGNNAGIFMKFTHCRSKTKFVIFKNFFDHSNRIFAI